MSELHNHLANLAIGSPALEAFNSRSSRSF